MTDCVSSKPKTLTVDQIVYRYPGGSTVLEGVSLTAQTGKVTMLVGRSGSGKTTLLRILQGLIRPRAGRVVRDPEGLVCAYIPQGLGLVRNATVLENVLNGALQRTGRLASLMGRFSAATILEAETTLERVGLAKKAGELAGRLSGGERQRVAIARCLMRRPDFVLADEFVSQLDAVTSLEMGALMRESADSGTGWIVTTHHLDAACESGDRVIALRAGCVALDRPAAAATAATLEEAIR